MFQRYMRHLKNEGFRTLALRDLEPWAGEPADPMLRERYPQPKDGKLTPPVEVEQTARDSAYWIGNMRRHGFSLDEIARAHGLDAMHVPAAPMPQGNILPYPGVRHTRIGFLDGAIDPQRGTKASVFLPWDPKSYVVIDVPEAIFSNKGLLYLAHTHVPTIWNEQNVVIDNVDWQRLPGGGLKSEWTLPNKVAFGATLDWRSDSVEMELWLRNGTGEPLSKLRTQICVLLRGAPGYAAQTNDNKRLTGTTALVRPQANGRRIAVEWERAGRVWGNPNCPCMHSDPVLPDCPSGETVRVKGKLWFPDSE
jgi:hypothetical protein